MSTTETNSYDADEWGQYRSLSTLAVVAFVLGLCSVVTFASPLMLVVPLSAAAVALLALQGIASSEGGLSGASLARWGLALAILFCVASLARVKVRDLIMQRQAERVARQWLSLAAEGRAEIMMDLMSKAAIDKVSPAGDTGQPTPSFFGGMLASALMRQDPLVLGLSELRKSGEVRYQLKDSQVVPNAAPPQAFLRYVATGEAPASGDGSNQKSCSLELKRFRATQNEQIWLIDAWELQ